MNSMISKYELKSGSVSDCCLTAQETGVHDHGKHFAIKVMFCLLFVTLVFNQFLYCIMAVF